VRVVQVEVELVHPALLVLQVGAVVVLIPDGYQDTRWFSRFHDRHHLVGFGVLEIRVQESVTASVVARAVGRFENRSTPLGGSVFQPILELVGDFRQGPSGHPLAITVGVEEAEHAFWLLERLDQAVEQKPVETPVSELDAILVVLSEGVHGALLCCGIPGD
jgi:hypothetical protein